MSYLEEFKFLLEGEKLPPFLHLWEEYCQSDEVDGMEVFKILKMIQQSSSAPAFGKVAETAIPLWEKIKDEEMADHVLRLILDLQVVNSPMLATLAVNYLSAHYKDDSDFNEKMRIVGLRTRQSFQGAITNFELLTHMDKGKFVFHTGGWGVGEVIDCSLLQEHVLLEFEGIEAPKDLTFENAFKNLIYLPSDHFLARRFGDPDTLEAEGKEDHMALLHLLLRDLGPKTAQEIKEELCELVIPEDEWSKWWQAARAKAKKDTLIQTPASSKEHFVLLDKAISHEALLKQSLQKISDWNQLVQTVYQYQRDFPQSTKNEEIKKTIKSKLIEALGEPDETHAGLAIARKMQISFLLEDLFPGEFPESSGSLIQSIDNLENVINLIDILAYKKRLLVCIRQTRSDWVLIFSHLFLVIVQNPLREYIFKELLSGDNEQLTLKVKELLNNMTLYPEAFFWYFQRVATKEPGPLIDDLNQYHFLEAYLILLHFIENKEDYRDLTKKMHNFLIAKRFLVVRDLIHGASLAYLKEFLLLASKCFSFTKQELKVLESLAEVVQPSLGNKSKKDEEQEEVIWTTQQGYQKIQERIREIGTVEMIDNAREIEAARAHGDLRENSEYKFALERRARLQAELQTLSRQINHARILTKHDVELSRVGPGAIVGIAKSDGDQMSYTLLGPWDADPDNGILSFQSKFAQAMMGYKQGDSFDFQGNKYKITFIKSFLG